VVARTGEEGALAAPPPSGAAIFLSVKPTIADLRLEPGRGQHDTQQLEVIALR